LKYGRITSERVEGERARRVVVVTVRLPQQLVDLVDSYRSRLGLSRSDVIRIALVEFFSKGGGRDAGG
jgi:metal-responsive CopG/Arc/MetJ family transcriptional regulator